MNYTRRFKDKERLRTIANPLASERCPSTLLSMLSSAPDPKRLCEIYRFAQPEGVILFQKDFGITHTPGRLYHN